jgi:hypothetical protein
LAKKEFAIIGCNENATVKKMKKIKIIQFVLITVNDGTQKSIPTYKMIDKKIDAIPTMVKHEFIKSFAYLSSFGRKRIIDIPRPSSDNIALIPKIERIIDPNPITSVGYALVAIIKKINPSIEFIPVPIIKSNAFWNNGTCNKVRNF